MVPFRCSFNVHYGEKMNFNISGKHALITGASQGIGLEIASLLAGEGVRCTLVARRKDILEAEVKTLSGKGHNIYSCDLHTPLHSFSS